MNKLKLAFDPTDVWNREDFRNIIYEFMNNSEVEIYLITSNSDIKFINNVALEMNIPSTNVHIVSNTDNILLKLDATLVDIYMLSDYRRMLFLDTWTETAICVLVNGLVDNYKNQMLYISKLQFWMKEWAKKNVKGESC